MPSVGDVAIASKHSAITPHRKWLPNCTLLLPRHGVARVVTRHLDVVAKYPLRLDAESGFSRQFGREDSNYDQEFVLARVAIVLGVLDLLAARLLDLMLLFFGVLALAPLIFA